MGFSYPTPIPPNFYDLDKGKIDWKGLREELRGKLCAEHIGFANGISTEDLAFYFFKRRDYEGCGCMEEQLQITRKELLEMGVILRNSHFRWHIVDNAPEAVSFIENRAKRVVRAYKRTVTVTEIATIQYPELADHPIPKALGGMTRSIKRLEEATTKETKITETTIEQLKLTEGKE